MQTKSKPKKRGTARAAKGRAGFSAQQTIPYIAMHPDGVCQLPGGIYTKTVEYEDINYSVASTEDQTAIFGGWSSFLNYFDSSLPFQLSFINRRSRDRSRYKVNTVRHEIIERYRPGEDDPHLKVLQAAHISDDEYFSHMVLDDLNLIIRDIRETHKKDSESAPQTTVANELKENLEAVENFKGSRLEKLAVLYCKQLGINYKNLSDEEFRWLIRILKKSKKMGTPISQRKKR